MNGVKQVGPRRCFAPGGSASVFVGQRRLQVTEGMARARPA